MKPAIAGGVLLVLWILGMVLWGSMKDIQPDMRSDGGYEPSKGVGHPLWND